jgi:hypothetical protein
MSPDNFGRVIFKLFGILVSDNCNSNNNPTALATRESDRIYANDMTAVDFFTGRSHSQQTKSKNLRLHISSLSRRTRNMSDWRLFQEMAGNGESAFSRQLLRG